MCRQKEIAMGLMSAAQYRASLRDGRVLYWGGQRIEDIDADPRFAIPIRTALQDYAYDDPRRGPILTYETEEGGLANRLYQVPRTSDDLLKRVELGRILGEIGLVSGVFMAMLSIKDQLATVNPKFAENIDQLYRLGRDGDLRAAQVITDAKGDRSRKANEQEDPDLYLRIVDRSETGITVRGAKLHITGAALVHELVVMPTKAMSKDEADYAVAFSIPVNTPGVKIINRSFSQPGLNPFDNPASAQAGVPDGFVVFDDVFVPWERVFLAGEWQLAGVFAQALGLWQRTMSVIGAAEQAEILVGLAQLVSEQQGKAKEPHTQDVIAEMICYAQNVRMAVSYACANFKTTPSGMVYPDVLAVNTAKYYYAANYHLMVRNLQDIAGGLVMTLPLEADLRSNETGGYLRKYLRGAPGADIEQRMRVFNLIRDLTADSLGGWNMVTTLQSGGGLKAQRIMMNRSFDMATARSKALAKAGAGRDPA
jgi:4-hydroxybutyryl-CoA dehydratase/vinylacetyl-CoA-Delta-isomerase